MGMALFNRKVPRTTPCHRVNWTTAPDNGQIAILISGDSLCRLLQSRQLHVEELTCLDNASRAKVRKLLLDLIR
ncbi:MAG TPA: hypothetical protein VKY53_09230 [Marinobacter sp.]|nr:hypothetical protein [Marinobacter sp.]